MGKVTNSYFNYTRIKKLRSVWVRLNVMQFLSSIKLYNVKKNEEVCFLAGVIKITAGNTGN